MLRVRLLCVGRVKAGPERELEGRYLTRATAAGRRTGLAFELREIDEARAQSPELRRANEAARLRAVGGAGLHLLALDETGDALDSAGFAALLAAARDEGRGSLALAIGGADGLDPGLRREAARTLSFGAMTWPHQLGRVMACEQLYRAVTILAGHPYHRA